MNLDAERPRLASSFVLPIVIFIATTALYSYVIFHVLVPSHFVKYTLAAQQYAAGKLPHERLLDYSPLYFQVNLFLVRHSTSPVIALQGIQISLVGISAVLLFLFLSRFFRMAIALTGTAAFILNRTLMAYTAVFEPEPFLLVWMLAAVYLAYRPSRISHAVAGLFFGLALLTRPNFSPVLLVIPLHFLFQQSNRRSALLSALSFAGPVLGCLILLWIRNTAILGYFSPFVMNPGTAIFEGNNPLSWGQGAVYPALVSDLNSTFPEEADYQHETYRMVARAAAGKNLTLPEVNSYWIQKASHFIRDYPMHSLRLFGLKVFHIFHEYQWHDLANAYWYEESIQQSLIPIVPFAFISAPALFGLIIKLKESRKFLLLYAVFFCQLAFMTVIYVHARHRIAILPLFIFFGCTALQFLAQRRKHLLLLIAIAPLWLLLHVQTDLMHEETHLWKTLRMSSRLRDEVYQLRAAGDWERAAGAAALALAYAPWQFESGRPANLPYREDGYASAALRMARNPFDFSSRFDRGILLMDAGKPAEAQQIFQQLIAENHTFKREHLGPSEPRYYLGLIAELQHDSPKALQWFREGLQHSPGDPYLLSHLFAITGRQEYRQLIFRYFDDLDAEFYLGRSFLKAGKHSEAVSSFTKVVKQLPRIRKIYFYLAAALSADGRNVEAAEWYGKAMAMRPEPVAMEPEMIGIFRTLANEEPGDAFAAYRLGVVLRQFGHYDEALQFQTAALKSDPANRHIQQELKALQDFMNRQHPKTPS